MHEPPRFVVAGLDTSAASNWRQMQQPETRWDGHQWVTLDGLWAWNGSQWLQFGSSLPVAARVAIYAALGLVLNAPVMLVVALSWGLQGPGWATNPPDVVGSIVQITLTLGGALFAFGAGWFLIRIDRRDWWFGAAFAWPWVASAAALLFVTLASNPLDAGGLLVSACLLLFAGVPVAGSIAGRRRWSANAFPPQSAQPSATLVSQPNRPARLFFQAFFKSAVVATNTAIGLPMDLPSNVSGDGKFTWDGKRWVPIEQSQSWPKPRQSQPRPRPRRLSTGPRAALRVSSPGLRQFCLVMLVLTSVITGLFATFALLGVATAPGPVDPFGIFLLGSFVVLFALPVVATVGVVRRSSWARKIAMITGIAVSLTGLGLVVGIPIIIAASRAPLGVKASPATEP